MFTFELQSGLGQISTHISPQGVILLDDPKITDALDYDQSAMEFGYPPSQLWNFYLASDKNPVAALHEAVIIGGSTFDFGSLTLSQVAQIWTTSLNVPINDRNLCISSLLLLDYAEHALLVYEQRHPRSVVYRRALLASRKSLKSQLQGVEIANINAIKAENDIWKLTNNRSDDSIAWLMHDAVSSWRTGSYGHIINVVKRAADFIGRIREIEKFKKFGSYRTATPEFSVGVDAETGWQIRRFSDVMTAVRAGKRWPVLKVTK